jgi:hypothetical protein
MISRTRAVMFAGALSLALAACGDDGGATTTAPPDPGTTQPDDTTTQPPTGDVGAWCSAVIEFDRFAAALPDPETDEEFYRNAAEIAPRFRVIANGAPAAIRAEAMIIAEGVEALAAGDEEPMFDEGFFEAFDAFDEFVFTACGYELES